MAGIPLDVHYKQIIICLRPRRISVDYLKHVHFGVENGKNEIWFLLKFQRPIHFPYAQRFLKLMKEKFSMKSIPTNFEASIREFVEAWLDGNKDKMREIEQREEIVKVRRQLWKVIEGQRPPQ